MKDINTDILRLLAPQGKTTIALIGLSKNAGKTSLLNFLIKSAPRIRFGIMSTGRDGEEQDTVFATPKPPVILSAGTIFCC
ncbi:MAG: hypothetical protein U1C33_03650, partial [Candidatus Cloacimonadaceae bacterium]|nr:hypothetical protein [Candidatus Cloacimonadaceae bacterium]